MEYAGQMKRGNMDRMLELVVTPASAKFRNRLALLNPEIPLEDAMREQSEKLRKEYEGNRFKVVKTTYSQNNQTVELVIRITSKTKVRRYKTATLEKSEEDGVWRLSNVF